MARHDAKSGPFDGCRPRGIFALERDDGPVVATAIHDGHSLRDEVREAIALPESERLREEDPFTWLWTEVGHSRVRMLRSRFEIDVNRPRHQAVYRRPEDAWGLDVWRETPRDSLIERSLEEYDEFYAEMAHLLRRLEQRHGAFVVYDIHSYNHRREGVAADPRANPTINLGTGTLDRTRFGAVADAFIEALRTQTIRGVSIDVRENVRFRGGYFARWIHHTFPRTGCALAIEVKKVFMDEATGSPDPEAIADVRRALRATVGPVVRALHGCRDPLAERAGGARPQDRRERRRHASGPSSGRPPFEPFPVQPVSSRP